jgi:hypothetical protein
VQGSEELVGKIVIELQFSRGELLLLEAESWDTVILRQPRVRGTFAVRSRYQATIGEYTADLKVLVRFVVNYWVYELSIAL